MASGGYYARKRLPEEWLKGDPSHSFAIAPAIGTLPAFRRILATKVGGAVADMNRCGMDPVVLLVGHGTTRVRSSGDAARRVRDELAITFSQTEILVAFLDESPRLAEVAVSLGDRPVVVAPLLLGGGPHVIEDVVGALGAAPTSLERGRMSETMKILPPILDWPELPTLVLNAMDSVSRASVSSNSVTTESVSTDPHVPSGAASSTVP
jgi:sirohydrochlorin ferrochelatase